jgi:hypothetical protein
LFPKGWQGSGLVQAKISDTQGSGLKEGDFGWGPSL